MKISAMKKRNVVFIRQNSTGSGFLPCITSLFKKMKKSCRFFAKCGKSAASGTPKGIRTPDLPLRRGTLYPAELLAHGIHMKEGPKVLAALKAVPLPRCGLGYSIYLFYRSFFGMSSKNRHNSRGEYHILSNSLREGRIGRNECRYGIGRSGRSDLRRNRRGPQSEMRPPVRVIDTAAETAFCR